MTAAFIVVVDLILGPGLGSGAGGAATAMAQAAMTVYVILYTCRRYPLLRFRFGKKALDPQTIRQGVHFGAPPAIQSGVSSVGSVFLQQFMNGFGEQTVAAITTAYRIDTVSFLPIINFGSGIATMVAQNIGAGDRQRAGQMFRSGLVLMTIISLALTMLVLALGGHLIAMFGLTEASVTIGVRFFRAIAGFYVVYGLSMAVRGFLEGNGDMFFSGAAGILALLVRIAGSYALKPVFDNMVVAYAEAFSWIFLLAILVLRYWRFRRGYQSDRI